MDRVSQVLAQGRFPDVPRTYAALVDQGDVPLLTGKAVCGARIDVKLEEVLTIASRLRLSKAR